VRWSVRCRVGGIQKRYDLGPVVEGDEDLEGLSLRTARERAMRVVEMARRGQDPATFLRALSGGVSVETQIKIEREKPKPSWRWDAARKAFLAEVERTRRGDTLRDYRGKLMPAELQRFEHRMVNTVTRNEMAEAVKDIHLRGAESMAEGVARVVKRFFSWLSEAAQQDATNVADGAMVKLSAPPRTLDEIGQTVEVDEEEGDAPPEIEIGRALAIARLGVFPERIGLGLQLLIGTAQRRRTVTGANRWRFKTYKEVNSEQVWFIPPYFRKSGTKRGRRSHLVPCVGFAAEAVERLDRLADEPEKNPDGWLFAAAKQNKAAMRHAASDLFNDYLKVIPDVNWTPHVIRYAFATYGERDCGFAKSEARIILDHAEGTQPDDVTGAFYSSDPAIARKREMMRAWTEWCETWAAEAIRQDPLLLDREFLMEAIFRERYGEERLEQRIEYRRRRGWPLWGPAGPMDDDEDEQQAAE
jgi:integrase